MQVHAGFQAVSGSQLAARTCPARIDWADFVRAANGAWSHEALWPTSDGKNPSYRRLSSLSKD